MPLHLLILALLRAVSAEALSDVLITNGSSVASADALTPSGVDAQAQANPVSIALFNNSALFGPPLTLLTVPSLDFAFPSPLPSFSAEVVTQLTFPRAPSFYVFACSLDPRVSVGFVWVDDHLVCQSKGPYDPLPNASDGTQATPLYRREGNVRPTVVRAHLYVTANGTASPIAFSLQWCETAAPSAGCTPGAIAAPALAPGLPPLEAARVALQRQLAAGWGLWMHSDVLSVVGLPSSAKLKVLLCRLSTMDCLQLLRDDCWPKMQHCSSTWRRGLHAHDRSIAQMYIVHAGLNASLTVLGGTGGLSVLVEAVGGCSAALNCSDYFAAVEGSFAWARLGTVAASADGASLTLAPLGMEPLTLHRSVPPGAAPPLPPLPPSVTTLPAITASLAQGGAAAFALGSAPPSVPAVRAAAAAAAAAELARYAPLGDLAEVAGAVQAAVAWTMVFTPVQLGPFPPVSRDWDFTRTLQDGDEQDPNTPNEWGYVLFGWDNLFAAFLLGASTRDAAYSALIQAVRAKAAAGFVSNFEAGGQKSQDRTEPLVGARVLLALHKKYGDDWLVELLLDDFLDWHDWVWRRRVGPLGLISLGSDPVQGFTLYSPNTMQGARFESGLDNSPMYDGSFFDDSVTHLMLAADVGMSSLFVAECLALAQLSRAVNRSADAEVLEARAASVRALIAALLWDEAAGTFKNYITLNDTLSTRVSPTSFYALGAGAASDAQAARMATEWALNSSRFCLSPQWPAGVSDACHWGLPSISADDPAFPALGYWRGYVWGPMAQLTYWSLEQYVHVPEVAVAKAALAKQMGATFLEQWRLNRHVCENFSPKKGATECTGSLFYNWGALAGILALEERGVY